MRVIVCGSLLVATVLVQSAPGAAAPRRPNILWICADDHTPYVIGTYGNQRVHTPNLDRLARGGMRFDRAYCNSPVCTASRDSFITGRYPRTIGVTQLNTPLPESETTLAHVLKRAGYDTGAIGKMHFNSPHTYGFDFRRDLGMYDKELSKRGKKPIPKDIAVQPRWKPFRDPASIWLNSRDLPSAAVDADMDASYFVEEATRFLSQPHAKPFFLMVSFYEPHSPYYFPIEDRGRFQPSSFPVPPVGPEDANQIPAVFRDLTPAQKQGIEAAYYTSVEFLDRKVGQVLDALDKSGQAQNTIVLYTADHGYLLGEHGRFEKHCSYEQAIRNPLIMRCPGIISPGSSTTALVEFVDIFPTLLDLCRVKVPENVQGRSLVSLLEGKTKTHRTEVFIEYAPNEEAAVRDEHWKLIFERGKRRRADGYDTGLPLSGRTIRLYDLDNDTAEMHNVAARPENAERVRQMLQDLADHMRSTAREPALVPQSDDPLKVLDYCVQSHDVGVPATSEVPSVPPIRLRRPFLLAGGYSLAVVLASLAGGWLPVVVRLTHTRLQIAMSLCGGLMLGVSLFHMLPQSVGFYGSLDRSVLWMLAGLLAMFFLIRAFHFHQHEPVGHRAQPLSWIGLGVGLGCYTLINGMSLAASVEADAVHGAWKLGAGTFAAIFLHRPLDAMPVSILASDRLSVTRFKQFVNGSFAILCPLGVAFFFGALKQFPSHRAVIVGSGLAFSAGVFLCISLSDLLPELEFHAHDRVALSLALIAGIALAYAIV
ncbi:MAG TPA: sulfatase-like hydrolase/transferase [Planctomycetaceae bacterium]|jgi:choline-sulfatase|nr:sulfatase-like hydrolase/transferase [Planctomycetaceae bacterium]